MKNKMDLTDIITRARNSGAGDIHLVPGEAPCFRVGRSLVKMADASALAPGDVEKLLLPYVSKELLQEAERRDRNTMIELEGGVRLRAMIYGSDGSPGATLRLIPDSLPGLDDYDFLEDLDALLAATRGLILVCGPGSTGKTAMGLSIIDRINQNYRKHIITLEDPVEWKIPPGKGIVRQRRVGWDVPAFEDGMRNVLREDADVVYVSEIRTVDSMAGLLTLAEVRCLVIATLHTLNPRHTIERILDIFPVSARPMIRKQLAGVLLGMVIMKRGKDGKISAQLCPIDETQQEAIRMEDLAELERC